MADEPNAKNTPFPKSTEEAEAARRERERVQGNPGNLRDSRVSQEGEVKPALVARPTGNPQQHGIDESIARAQRNANRGKPLPTETEQERRRREGQTAGIAQPRPPKTTGTLRGPVAGETAEQRRQREASEANR